MKTARAVVIDEDRDEALHLLQALGCAGIGAIYFSGDNPDLLPKTPLDGIRVVFLDLKLINQPEAKHFIPHAVAVLKTCVALKPRTTGIICWSKHSDEIAALKQELLSQEITPAFLLALESKADLSAKGVSGIKEVITQLDQQLSKNLGHRMLVDWEEVSHAATTEATGRLLTLSKDDGDLLRLLAAIANAVADEAPTSSKHTLHALCAGLASLHADAVEDAIGTIADQSGNAVHDVVKQLNQEPQTDADREAQKKLSLDANQRAHLNSVLLTMSSDTLRPGNVYLAESTYSRDDQKDEFKKTFALDVFGKKDLPAQIAQASKIVGVELTPACDHAAQKTATARMVLGLLIQLNADLANKAKLPATSRLFAKEIEPIQLQLSGDANDQTYKLVVSARHLKTKSLAELKKEKPLFRLRASVVADIQAWFASHAARPGYVSLR